jgi:hypothetical protein
VGHTSLTPPHIYIILATLATWTVVTLLALLAVVLLAWLTLTWLALYPTLRLWKKSLA